MSAGRSRSYFQIVSPVLASIASTWFCGVETNMTPLLTIGGAWCASTSPVDSDQTGTRSPTLPPVIWSSGL